MQNTSHSKIFKETLEQLEFNSVIEYLKNLCFSTLASELINNSTPTSNINSLIKEHKSITEMIDLIIKEKPLSFDGFSDIRNLLYKSKVKGATLTSTELLAIYDTMRTARLIKNFFQNKVEEYKLLSDEVNWIYINRLTEKHITDAIDESGDVKDSASVELARIRKEIFDKSNKLRHKLEKLKRNFTDEDILQDEFVTLREGRFVLPIKAEHKRHISGIIHGVSQTGSTVFLEPSEIIELNNELSLLYGEEKREIHKILTQLTEEIGNQSDELLNTLQILAHLDALTAKAKYAIEFGGIEPKIIDDKYIYLKNIRHPILVQSKGLKKIVPLSIEFTPEKRGHLISGPNAGGKTVALKSIGLNILMALSGIFPLGECQTCFVDIYASIGDQQSIENDLSTFTSQMIRIKEILSYCDKDSLVLIDEIGSGTDPIEGSALAAGILDTLIDIQSFFVVTTHQSSLKTYALNRETIQNDSLAFDEKNMIPTYQFLHGIPGNSYAFIVAQNIGLQQRVIDRAKKYQSNEQKELEKSISILHQYQNEIQELRNQLCLEKKELEKIKSKFEEKYSNITKKREEILQKAKIEANEIIQKANSLIENTIKEIREEKKKITEIKKSFEEKKINLEKHISTELAEDESSIQIFNTGDYVKIKDTNTIGLVIESDLNSKSALIECNNLKFRLPFAQLEKAQAPTATSRKNNEYIKFDLQRSIDIRGKRVDEALKEIDNFLSNAITSNIQSIIIIHGKGTGALREAIHNYLKFNQHVKSFRIGELVEGGAGVTIAELD